jgi:hypothetical protein
VAGSRRLVPRWPRDWSPPTLTPERHSQNSRPAGPS